MIRNVCKHSRHLILSGILFIFPLAFATCDLHDVDEGGEPAEIVVKIYNPETDAEELSANLDDSFTIKRVEINFNSLQFINRFDEPVEFSFPDSALEVNTFGRDFKLSENLLLADVYNEIELKIGAGRQTDKNLQIKDSINQNDEDSDFAIRIRGTVGESDFIYDYKSEIALNFKLSPPLRINVNSLSQRTFRLLMDYSEWFTSDDNQFLDPADTANEKVINENILHSIHFDLSQPSLVIQDSEVRQSEELISFKVELTQEASVPVTVEYETADQSAKAGEHYVETSDTLTFAPGETVQTIDIELLNASFRSPERKFRVILSNPDGAALHNRDRQATGTIINDAASYPGILIHNAEAMQDDDVISFDIELLAESSNTVFIDFETADQSAKAGENYVEKSGTVTFNPGKLIQTIDIDLLNASFRSPERRFRVILSNPDGAVLHNRSRQATGVIKKNASSEPELIPQNAEALLTEEVMTFTAELTSEASGPVTVHFETADQSARAGRDYKETTGSLTFKPGEISKTIDVELLNASFNSPQRRFRLIFSNPEGAELHNQNSQVTGTILRD